MIDFWECGGVRSLLGCEGRSLFGDVGKGDRCFGMMECDRFLWMWEAIAFGMMECDRFWDDGVRSLFVDVRGDRFWECGGAIAFGNVEGRSLFWGCGRRSLFWVCGGALAVAYRRYRCLGIWGGRSLFGDKSQKRL
ncbi:MAG: hypothetical protein ACKPA7_22365 [Sphaerospermopsis kisseleviana]